MSATPRAETVWAMASIGRTLRKYWDKLLARRDDPRLVRAARAAIGILTAVLLAVTVCARFLPKSLNLELNRPAPETIYADRTIKYEDELEWERRKQEARNSAPPVYDSVHERAQRNMLARLDEIFSAVAKVQEAAARARPQPSPEQTPAPSAPATPTPSAAQALAALRAALPEGVSLSEDTLALLLASSSARLEQLRGACEHVLRWESKKDSRADVRDDRIDAFARMENRIFALQGLTDEEKEAAYDICTNVWEPTMVLNEALTAKAREDAAKAVPKPSPRVIQRGQIIVRRGAVVDEQVLRDAQALGLLQPAVQWDRIIYSTVFLFGTILLGSYFLRAFARPTYEATRRLMVVAGMAVLGAVIINLATRLPTVTPYLALLAAQLAAVVITTLFEAISALMTVALLAIIAGLLASNDLFSTVIAFLGGCLAVMQSTRLSQRPWSLVWLGATLGLINFAMVLVGRAVFQQTVPYEPTEMGRALTLSLVAGLGAILPAYFLIRLLEGPLEIVTEMRLLELSSPHEPLLHRLLTEAPGTYNASFLISNLAGSAAEAIGANSLLVRVGALYHDIGKLTRPYFFVENQFGRRNPLAEMSPALAALVVISHVKDGLELGRQARLPKPILDLIAQHHGTTLVEYFYHKAVEEQGKENVPESRFRYPGPKPQTKEAAILMIADSAEAAVRSIKDPTASKIETMVKLVLKEKLEQEQFDECPITLRELNQVAQSLCRSFQGIYHTRIEYPSSKELLEELEGKEEQTAQG